MVLTEFAYEIMMLLFTLYRSHIQLHIPIYIGHPGEKKKWLRLGNQ